MSGTPKIISMRVEQTQARLPWSDKSKLRTVYNVIAIVDGAGEMLAARFTSKTRANTFAEQAEAKLWYSLFDPNDKYQKDRPARGLPLFGWQEAEPAWVTLHPLDSGSPLSWFVDELVSGPINMRWAK